MSGVRVLTVSDTVLTLTVLTLTLLTVSDSTVSADRDRRSFLSLNKQSSELSSLSYL